MRNRQTEKLTETDRSIQRNRQKQRDREIVKKNREVETKRIRQKQAKK